MDGMVVVLILILSFALYFMPSIVAGGREHKNVNSIVLLNLFLGWTIVGWVVALVWAASHQPERSSNPEGKMKRCQHCAEEIQMMALKCKHCGSSVLAQ